MTGSDDSISDDYLAYTIKRYLNVLKQGSYGSTYSEQKNFLDTITYVEGKVDRLISEKNSQIEKHISDKIDAERKTKILESERDFNRRELAQREKELENCTKEKERLGKALKIAEDDVVRLQKTLEQFSKSREEDTELTQKMVDKLLEKERGRIRKKMSEEYQKEIDELKTKILDLGEQIHCLKQTQELRDREILESREESNMLRMKCSKLTTFSEKIQQICKNQKNYLEELDKLLGSCKDKIPSLEDLAKGAQLYSRLSKGYDDLELASTVEDAGCVSFNSDFDKITQLLKASIERERKLEDNLTYTMNLNQVMNRELETCKKSLTEMEESISSSAYLEKSSLYQKKIQAAASNVTTSFKVKSIIEICEEFAKANSSLREKVKTTQANNELLSQELSQLHKSKLETVSSQKQYYKEKEQLVQDLEEFKQKERELVKKLQADSENFSKIIHEKQSVIEKYKEIIENKGVNISSLEETCKNTKKELEQKIEDLEKILKEKKDLEQLYHKTLHELEEAKEENASNEILIAQIKNQNERLTALNNDYSTKAEELEMQIDVEKEKVTKLESQLKDLQLVVSTKETEIERNKTNLVSLEKSKQLLEKELEQLRNQSQDTEYKVKDSERSITDKQRQISDLYSQIEEKDQEIMNLKSNLKDQKKNLFEKEQLFEEMKISYQEAKRSIEKKETEIMNLRLEIEQLKSGQESLKSKCSQFGKTNSELDELVEDLRKKVKQTEDKWEAKLSEIKENHHKQLLEIKSRYEMDKTSHISELEGKLEQKEMEIEELQLQVSRLNKQKDEKMIDKDLENERLSKQLEEVKEKLRTKERDLSDITKNYKKIEKEYLMIMQDLQESRESITQSIQEKERELQEKSRSKLSELNSSYASLQNKLNLTQNELDAITLDFEQKTQEYEQTILDLQGKLAKERKERSLIASNKSVIEQKDKQIAELQNEKMQLAKGLKFLNDNVSVLQDELRRLKKQVLLYQTSMKKEVERGITQMEDQIELFVAKKEEEHQTQIDYFNRSLEMYKERTAKLENEKKRSLQNMSAHLDLVQHLGRSVEQEEDSSLLSGIPITDDEDDEEI